MALSELWIETRMGRVYGRTAGPATGPLVLGLHGWSQRNGWHTWEPLLLPLGAAGFHAVSVDMPGWGQSPPLGSATITKEQAMQVVVAILDEMGVETAVVMGKSWGGGIALNMALAYPERISKLILTAPAFRRAELLPTVAQPVLLAWAEDDPVIPYKYAVEFTDKLPNCQLETYPTGGHSAAPKNVVDFASKAVEFLEIND